MIGIEEFSLKRNAQFYKKNEVLEEDAIRSILIAAESNASDDLISDIFREDRVFEEISFKLSLKAFPTDRKVFFLAGGDYFDTVYAYILILEFDDYLVVLKKSCGNIEPVIKKYTEVIDYNEISSLFNDEEDEFQRLSLRNMTVSDRAIRNKSFEAANLNGLISTHSAGRSIPHTLRIKNGTEVNNITTTTGRINQQSERSNLNYILKWCLKIIDQINAGGTSAFLSNFARPIQLKKVLETSIPISLLIEVGALSDSISTEGVELKLKTKKGDLVDLTPHAKNRFFSDLEIIYNILFNDPTYFISNTNSKGTLKINEKSLTFDHFNLKRLRVIENGKDSTLQSYIIKKKFYSICFDNPIYMYFMGQCFEDVSGVSEIDSILDILKVKSEMDSSESEKGEFGSGQTHFSGNSVFDIVETIHSEDDYIFCDDLGIEWADHITFNIDDGYINFIHSKFGETSSGASKLHDVVGQGIKNIGHMYFTKKTFLDKIDNKFKDYYRIEGIQTDIWRIRKGNIDDFENHCNAMLGNYRLVRRCILACSFLSKYMIEVEFNKIKNGQKVSGHIIQLLWIISSFIHATKEANIIPEIYCKP